MEQVSISVLQSVSMARLTHRLWAKALKPKPLFVPLFNRQIPIISCICVASSGWLDAGPAAQWSADPDGQIPSAATFTSAWRHLRLLSSSRYCDEKHLKCQFPLSLPQYEQSIYRFTIAHFLLCSLSKDCFLMEFDWTVYPGWRRSLTPSGWYQRVTRKKQEMISFLFKFIFLTWNENGQFFIV